MPPRSKSGATVLAQWNAAHPEDGWHDLPNTAQCKAPALGGGSAKPRRVPDRRINTRSRCHQAMLDIWLNVR